MHKKCLFKNFPTLKVFEQKLTCKNSKKTYEYIEIHHNFLTSTYITFGIYKGPTKDKDLSLIIQVNLLKVLSYHVRFLLQKIDI